MKPLEYIYRERGSARLNLKWARGRNDVPAIQRLEERLQVLDELERGLKPAVTWEQVKKAWKGEWERPQEGLCKCSCCGHSFLWLTTSFCPGCGRAMTDDAIDMVMDRLNELTSEEENNGKMHPLRKGPGNPGEDR